MMSTVEKQPKKRNLSRRRILDAAFVVLDEQGLDGMTLRSIAQKLDVQAPALYRHFKNKDEVLIEMAQLLVDEWSAACALIVHSDWKPWLTECCTMLRRVVRGHRDGPRLFMAYHSYAQTSLTRDIMTMLSDQGFAPADIIPSVSTLTSFVVGFTLEEDFERRTEPIAELKMAEGIDPVFLVYTHDYDLQFDYGVARIIEGIARR